MGARVTETVLRTIARWRMFEGGGSVIVALSGGADSCALLHCLHANAERLGIGLHAVHVNHSLRGADADGDEIFCGQLCAAYGVPFKAYRADVRSEAKLAKKSVEEAGRDARYACFEAEARRVNAKWVAVAHNKDDNAETILYNLLRGAGPKGLSGIPPVRNFFMNQLIDCPNAGTDVHNPAYGSIVRPLIDCPRSDIEVYCAAHGLAYRTDNTNSSTEYTRNKIRLELLPWIRRELNPAAADAVINCTALVAEDGRCLDDMAGAVYADCLAADGSLDAEQLAAYPDAIARRMLRNRYRDVSGSLKDLARGHAEAMLGLLGKQSGASLDLPGGVTMQKCYNKIFINKKKYDDKTHAFCYNLMYNEEVFVGELGITVFVTDSEPDGAHEKFYINNSTGPVCFRSRQLGDRIYFSSIGGHKRIKNLFNEKKITACERDRVGMFAQDDDIIWIPSLNIKSDKYTRGGECVYAGIR